MLFFNFETFLGFATPHGSAVMFPVKEGGMQVLAGQASSSQTVGS